MRMTDPGPPTTSPLPRSLYAHLAHEVPPRA